MRRLAAAFLLSLALAPAVGDGDALAERPAFTPDDAAAYWEEDVDLYIDADGPVYLGREFELVEGPTTFTLSGMFFPVLERNTEGTVGFVYVGRGEVELRFPADEDALGFANRMVMALGADPDAMRPIAHGEAPYIGDVRSGVVFTADPEIGERISALKKLRTAPEPSEGADGTIVVRSKVDTPLTQARSVLNQRRVTLRGTDRDPDAMLKQDLLLRDVAGAAGDWYRLIADFGTTEQLAGALGSTRRAGNKWITAIRDPRGFLDPRVRTLVRSYGLNDEGRTVGAYLSAELFPASDPEDALSPPLPELQLAVTHTHAQVEAVHLKKDLALALDFSPTLSLEARGGPAQHLLLRVPKVEANPNSWAVEGAWLADGSEVALLQIDRPQLEDRRQVREQERGGLTGTELFLAVLPEPLAEGETAELELRWSDTWPAAKVAFSDQGALNMGQSSGFQRAAPHALPRIGPGVGDWTLTVGMELGSGLMSAQSGTEVREWHGEGWRWQESQSAAPSTTPALAIGKWKRQRDEPIQGLPGIEVHMFERDQYKMHMFAPEVRRIILFYQNFLPDFPYPELELFQAPDDKIMLAKYDDGVPNVRFDGGFPGGVQGLISINQYKAGSDPDDNDAIDRFGNSDLAVSGDVGRLRNFLPKISVTRLAYQVAHQYWGQWLPVANERDLWVAQSLSEAYAEMYLRAAHGREDYDLRQTTSRDAWEKWMTDSYAPLTRAYETDRANAICWYYGPYVLMEMLRRRIGADYFAALDKLVAARGGDYITTEHLQQAFEEQTGRDYTDFFNYWVHGGYVPELTLEYHLETDADGATRAVGTMTSDVPFGTIDVPVRIVDGERQSRVWVNLVDGEGEFLAEGLAESGRKLDVLIDPAGYVLARSRKARRVNAP